MVEMLTFKLLGRIFYVSVNLLEGFGQVYPEKTFWSLGITVKGWLTLIPLLASLCL